MEILYTIILGIVQGLTEFLPVSSSGHIAIANSILDTGFNSKNYVLMNIVLHGATASSILYVFRKDLFKIFSGILSKNKGEIQFSCKILISMIPTIIIGLFFEDMIKVLFSGENKFLQGLIGKDYILTFVGLMLLITASLLLLADKSKPTNKNISLFSSMIIGCAQAIAILPGISRSGGALGIGVGDKVLMMENSWYSVISPENCSTILWRSWEFKEKAASALKLTSEDMMKNKLIDGIIKEPIGGAHTFPNQVYKTVKKSIKECIKECKSLNSHKLVQKRMDKFSKMGVYNE